MFDQTVVFVNSCFSLLSFPQCQIHYDKNVIFLLLLFRVHEAGRVVKGESSVGSLPRAMSGKALETLLHDVNRPKGLSIFHGKSRSLLVLNFILLCNCHLLHQADNRPQWSPLSALSSTMSPL
jgi:hypothetical protein